MCEMVNVQGLTAVQGLKVCEMISVHRVNCVRWLMSRG